MDHQKALDEITSFASEVGSLSKEAARVARFAQLLKAAFGDDPRDIADFTGSIERGVTYFTGKGTLVRRGRVDAMLGHAIIEFKTNLAAARQTALAELRAYAAGLSAGLDYIPFIGIATDGLRWECFTLGIPLGTEPAADAIEVTESETFDLEPTRGSAEAFYWFLQRKLLAGGQREATPESFVRDFGPTGPVFGQAWRVLQAAWQAVGTMQDVGVARSQWAKYLQYAYGSKVGEGVEGDRLYLKHTYLAALAKFMVWAAFLPQTGAKDDTQRCKEIISGEFLSHLHIRGTDERDIFHWVLKDDAAKLLTPVWVRLLSELKNYRLKDLKADVLKVLYETLVDPSDRHALGEYYTPDWLCEAVVDELLPVDEALDLKVLDPTCGSGSFLVAAIHRLRTAMSQAGTVKVKRADKVVTQVVGFDIHPLAVIVARANYLLAMGELIEQSPHNVFLPVYLADAMIDDRASSTPLGMFADKGVPLTIGDPALPSVVFPKAIAETPGLFDPVLDVASLIGEAIYKGEGVTEDAARALLDRRLGRTFVLSEVEREALATGVRRLGTQMGTLALQGRDTIWSFIARNFFRPFLYRQYFDVVVGNPPWLAFRFISNPDYKARLTEFATSRYGVCGSASSLRTQTEVATTFLAHASQVYLKKNGRIAFVVPRSVFSADQHAKLREGPHMEGGPGFRIDRLWDLADVSPLFNVPSCVVYARAKKREGMQDAVPGEVFDGRLSRREPPPGEATDRLTRRKVKFHLVRMGQRSAWSDNPDAVSFSERSFYADKFFQGATIVPRNAFFVRVHGELPKYPDKSVLVETDLEQAKTAKEPWKSLRFRGQVERRFVFKSALAKHLLPFTLDGELPDVVLPLLLPDDDKGEAQLLSARQIRDQGFMDASRYFGEVEKQYAAHRKGAASDRTETVPERINYNNGLVGQQLTKRWVVAFCRSGTHVTCCAIDTKRLQSPFVIDFALYGLRTASGPEAHYLQAVLNAQQLNEIIKPFQSRGLMGERDITKKPLEAPIPQFDRKIPLHTRLAELGELCAELAAKALPGLKGKTVGARRSAMRVVLKDQLAEIDALLPQLIKGL